MRHIVVACVTLLTIGLGGLGTLRQAQCQTTEKVSLEEDFSAELPRIPPLSPTEALARFEVAKGFKIELVAAEPLVFDPVAFSFNAKGDLFVVEMIDYSEQENDFLGRIAKLSDTDRDGKMDRRTVFVEKLSWPTAIHAWKDGVIVIAPPFMTWFRDTDQDGKHDARELWCEGFGRSNVQGMANSLRWSVEGFLVGSTSSSGAQLTGTLVGNHSLELRGRDFRIDPVSKQLSAISGGAQHGASMNRWGDRFVSSNSDHLQQVLDLDRWLAGRNVGSLPITTRRSIAEDGPQAEVYRSSPIEPWRIVRTRLRVSGKVRGAVEGGGRAAGYFTGATGAWIVDSEAGFGVPGFDTALVCDVGSNLVHRKKLESKELFWTASRIDDQTEFVRSSDIWFRPVQLGDGPDGALYIADMYREVIEHPKSLPPEIKKHLDLTSGTDRGRIWRVSPVSEAPAKPALASTTTMDVTPANLDSSGLVERLSSPIAWQRLMASQLLIERQAINVTPLLRTLVLRSTNSATQTLAMHLLARLGKLDDESLAASMESLDPHVNRHAIALTCQMKKAESLLTSERIATMISHSDARLRLELAMAASSLPISRAIPLLQQLIPQASDSTTRSVIIASAGDESWQLLSPTAPSSKPLDANTEKQWLASLLPYWCQQLTAAKAQSNSPLRSKLQQFVHRELAETSGREQLWADVIAKLPSRGIAERFFACWFPEDRLAWQEKLELAIDQAGNNSAEQERRAAWLRFTSAKQRGEWLNRALAPNTSGSYSLPTIEACLWADAKLTTSVLLDRFSSTTPRIQEPILLTLVGQPDAVESLAEAIEGKRIPIPQITPIARQRMSNHPDMKVRKRFLTLLAASEPTDRQLKGVIDEYVVALQANAERVHDATVLEHGKAIFQKNCATCHRIGNDGQDVGPPLKSLHEKSPEQLLISVLDPNREVDPRFQAYSVLIDDGRVMTGVIREESSNQIVLAESGGKLTTIARDDIEQVKGNGFSLMPQGLQQQINPQEMSELIAWLRIVKEQ